MVGGTRKGEDRHQQNQKDQEKKKERGYNQQAWTCALKTQDSVGHGGSKGWGHGE